MSQSMILTIVFDRFRFLMKMFWLLWLSASSGQRRWRRRAGSWVRTLSSPLSILDSGWSLLLSLFFREADLSDFQVFLRCSITILGSDIVLKSCSIDKSTLCLFIELGGSFVTDCSELRRTYNWLPGIQRLIFAAWYSVPGDWWRCLVTVDRWTSQQPDD